MIYNSLINTIVCSLIALLLSGRGTCQKLDWSYQNDSAKYYFELGWRYVMDEGNYSASEIAYRKMYENDPNFLVGVALLGRISSHIDEQVALLEEIHRKPQPQNMDERKALEVYKALHELMITRVNSPEKSPEQVKRALNLSLTNTGDLARKYIDEPYLLSEYIETIHYLLGAEQALDSLSKYDPNENVVFLMGYKALLYAELGKVVEALTQADKLFLLFPGGDIPKPYAVKAQIYDILNEQQLCFSFADRALLLDPKNVDMLRLKSKYRQD